MNHGVPPAPPTSEQKATYENVNYARHEFVSVQVLGHPPQGFVRLHPRCWGDEAEIYCREHGVVLDPGIQAVRPTTTNLTLEV